MFKLKKRTPVWTKKKKNCWHNVVETLTNTKPKSRKPNFYVSLYLNQAWIKNHAYASFTSDVHVYSEFIFLILIQMGTKHQPGEGVIELRNFLCICSMTLSPEARDTLMKIRSSLLTWLRFWYNRYRFNRYDNHKLHFKIYVFPSMTPKYYNSCLVICNMYL